MGLVIMTTILILATTVTIAYLWYQHRQQPKMMAMGIANRSDRQQEMDGLPSDDEIAMPSDDEIAMPSDGQQKMDQQKMDGLPSDEIAKPSDGQQKMDDEIAKPSDGQQKMDGLPSDEIDKPSDGQQKMMEIAKRFGRPPIPINYYEEKIAQDIITPDRIDVEFEHIGGLENVKQSLFELVILPLRRPELFARGGKLLSPQKGILLFGPPGTGKTMLAKAIAKESGAVFIEVKLSNLMSKWFGDAQKLVAALFSLAHKLQPAIIFIDEVDSFLRQRSSTDDETRTGMKTEFMVLWDGLTTNKNARVMVLAATNRPADLDEAILRRFPQAFEIGLPNCSERVKILKLILKDENVEDNIDFVEIASLCQGYSGSDLTKLCRDAAYCTVRDLLDAEKNGDTSPIAGPIPRPLSQSDLKKVLDISRKTSVVASEYNMLNSGSVGARSRNEELGISRKTSVVASEYNMLISGSVGARSRNEEDRVQIANSEIPSSYNPTLDSIIRTVQLLLIVFLFCSFFTFIVVLKMMPN